MEAIDPATGKSYTELFAAGGPTRARLAPSVLKWKMFAYLDTKLRVGYFSGVLAYEGLSPNIMAFIVTIYLGYTVRVGNGNMYRDQSWS